MRVIKRGSRNRDSEEIFRVLVLQRCTNTEIYILVSLDLMVSTFPGISTRLGK